MSTAGASKSRAPQAAPSGRLSSAFATGLPSSNGKGKQKATGDTRWSEPTGSATTSSTPLPVPDPPLWHGYLHVQVLNPQKEGVGLPTSPVLGSDAPAFVPTHRTHGSDDNNPVEMVLPEDDEEQVYVSYLIRGRTNLPHFARSTFELRRRYRDFDFLHDALVRDFPACVVPPLPDKHRLSHLAGDRFSPEFIQRRTADLNIFLERLCRHPILMRTPLLCSFLSSREWTVEMHAHKAAMARTNNLSATGDANTAPGLLDSWGDKLVNVFAKVKQPDERFVKLSADLELFREALTALDGVVHRGRSHAAALADEYDDFGLSFKMLAELETGMATILRRFSDTLSENSRLARLDSMRSTEHLVPASHALVAYAQAYQRVLSARDAKQIDFEELATYLSGVVSERDRLASLTLSYGSAPGRVRAAGITGYLRDRFDNLRGVDEERTRVERLQRLDARIAELRDAVSTSHDVLKSFTDQVLTESILFEYTKQAELTEVLSELASSKVAMYEQSVQHWDRMLHSLGVGSV